MLEYITNRLKEPSTYAGIAVIAGLVGVKITPEAWEAGVQILTGVAALVAMLVPDGKAVTKN